jgi:predicted HTH domain antitoxin
MASSTSHRGNDELATAVGRYALGEISLGKAAESAGMSRWEFEEVLDEVGFTALYGPRADDALRDELDVARDLEE